MSDAIIRRAQSDDLPALLDIYNHYVVNTHVTFDLEPRTLAQRREWFDSFGLTGRYQCFVAADGGSAIGWACSARFKDRAGYDTSVETSVYLAPGHHGKGLGRQLYATLFGALTGQDIHRAYGGVALPNEASVALHLATGFHHFGTYKEVGRKFDRYWDVAWYERALR
jgi:phosphinothricin acetyltransferase